MSTGPDRNEINTAHIVLLNLMLETWIVKVYIKFKAEQMNKNSILSHLTWSLRFNYGAPPPFRPDRVKTRTRHIHYICCMLICQIVNLYTKFETDRLFIKML